MTTSRTSVEAKGDSLGVSSWSYVESEKNKTDLSEASYSFCRESYDDSASFTLLSVPGNNSTVSSVSTKWEIVMDTLPSNSVALSSRHNEYNEGSCNSSVSSIYTSQNVSLMGHFVAPSKQCAICLCGKKDTLRLFHKCNHPQACLSCLRTYYIDHHIQTRDSSKFPLTCFWPGCHRKLRNAQIRHLVKNQDEMNLYHVLNNSYKRRRKAANQKRLKSIFRQVLQQRRVLNFKTLQDCIVCATPSSVHPSRTLSFVCVQCQTQQNVTVISPKEVKSIVEAVGDFLVNCPTCEQLICKDGGCDYMTCVCGENFSFDTAHTKFGKHVNWSSSSPGAIRGLATIKEQNT
mmetsp:Transcript_36563/g.41714  ORF Transcript_36563/g.41714 Transcript_36563/m.41714 type:complete len:346 (-) Transcript_36563:36-1073(-)